MLLGTTETIHGLRGLQKSCFGQRCRLLSCCHIAAITVSVWESWGVKVCADDHPLVVQLAANDPTMLRDAARWAQDRATRNC